MDKKPLSFKRESSTEQVVLFDGNIEDASLIITPFTLLKEYKKPAEADIASLFDDEVSFEEKQKVAAFLVLLAKSMKNREILANNISRTETESSHDTDDEAVKLKEEQERILRSLRATLGEDFLNL